MVTQDPATQEPRLLEAAAAEHGLAVRAIHAPFLLMTRRVWGTDPVHKIYRAVHLAELVGASTVVVHPPCRWQARYRRWLDERLAEFSATTGVTVAVENMFPVRVGDRGVHFHAPRGFEGLDGAPHLVLDTSHAAVAGADIRAAFDSGRDRIRHIHLSNNAGKGWDSHLPVHLEGVLPIPEFVGDVAAAGFDGLISLEYDLRPWLRDDDALHGVLVRNRELVEGLLAGDARHRVPAPRRRT